MVLRKRLEGGVAVAIGGERERGRGARENGGKVERERHEREWREGSRRRR